jgi:hypothetical protein
MQRFVTLVLSVLLAGCAESHTTAPSGNSGKVFGWRSAGLILSDANNTGGLHKLTHIDDALFAMDAYLPKPVLDTNRPYRWRLWQGRVGSLHWDSLPMPNGNTPNCWTVFSGRLYVGTKYTGEVWIYDPTTSRWDSLALPAKPESPVSIYSVSFLGQFQGDLVLGIDVRSTNKHFCWEGSSTNPVGTKIPCIGTLQNITLDQVQEFGGALYGINYQYGVYRYVAGASAWEQLASPRGRAATVTVDPCAQASSALGNVVKASCPQTSANQEDEYVSLLGVHDGHLYVGYTDYQDGLYRWNGDGTWRKMTPVSDTLNLNEAPRDIRSFESYRGRMYMSGTQYSTPLLWKPKDTAVPHFGDWMNVPDGWCRDEYGCGSQTWGIMGVGDTLYSIGWGFVAKVPLSEIDSMAVHEYDPKFYK